jgi:ATP adenylyltransferase
VAELSKLTKQEKQDLFELLEINKTLIDKVLKPSGYNVGINLGRSAGAGYPDHLHIHMVPRWKSDVNFMPVTADTKVISQSLKTIYDLLKDAYQKRH